MTKVVLHNVRASFVHVFKPYSFEGQDPRYSMQMIMPKDHPELPKLKQAITEAAREKWGQKLSDERFKAKLKLPLRDGDDYLEEHPDRSEYSGMVFFNANSKNRRPQLFRPDKTQLLEEDDLLHSGDYVNVVLSTFAFDTNGNRGVAVGLNGVQFKKKGPSLGGASDCTNDFDEEIEVSSDDDLIG